ncbi:MAG: hypothetical protein KGL16_14565 [Acidobacteriota bacterium]|nr:hypothetical protein [Acidobacteriota bacterium]
MSRGGWRDLVTILHPPYTAWHLSYVAIGAALAPTFVLWRLGAALGAFLLALGVSAHALDELAGRPLGTRLSRTTLLTMAVTGLGGAVAIGIVAALTVSLWLVALIVVGVFLALAYNLELFAGRFHTNLWFAVAWGGFPAFTGWFVEAVDVRPEAVLAALACSLLSLAQRRLSTPARELRRRTLSVTGQQILRDGQVRTLDEQRLLEPLEGALRALWLAMVVLAAALVIGRL